MSERQQHLDEFLATQKLEDAKRMPIAGDASFRRYIRILPEKSPSLMLMDASPEKETIAPYMAAADYLCRLGFSAPEIVASDRHWGFLLLEDLGDDSFTRVLAANAGLEEELYRAAIDVLVEWYKHSEKTKFYDLPEMPLRAYDQSLLIQEVKLFADWYLPQIMESEKIDDLREEYLSIWYNITASAENLACDQWVHRDFHADNLMWLPSRSAVRRVGLLDFQDGVIGDSAYDLVSLLEDARRDVPQDFAAQMVDYYVQRTGTNADILRTNYALLGAQRNSKIIGIFTRLAARDGKHHYLKFLPRVWRHLERDVEHPSLGALKHWLDKYVPKEHRGVISILPPIHTINV